MKVMPLIIIKIFTVMEIISHYEALAEVISLVWISTLTLAMTNLQFAMTKAKTNYFLAMIMAEILFLVFGIILISAFYLIKKLKKIYFEGEKHNEKDFSNNNGFAYYGKRKCIRYVWS